MMGVYFAKSPQLRLIKIGKAVDTRKRLRSLQGQCSDKIEVLGFIPSNTKNESYMIELHLQYEYNSYRHHGEWFKENSDLINYIQTNSSPDQTRLLNSIVNDAYENPKIPTIRLDGHTVISEVFAYVLNHPQTDPTEISKALRLYKSVTAQHLNKLRLAGLIKYSVKNKRVELIYNPLIDHSGSL